MRTSDAGETWSTIANADGTIREIQFVDAEHGWALGDRDVLTTTDGGVTWAKAAVDPATLGS